LEECALPELKTELLCEMGVTLGEARELGATPHGNRRIVPVTGGTFTGPKLTGEVLPGGGDWLSVRPDGASELDVRITLRTDDGHLIYVSYRGIVTASPEVIQRRARGEAVDPSEVYFRTTPVFETGSEKYGWLNRIVAVGVGRRKPIVIEYTVYAVL
jgi:Protein of unknown function (DUF3237)